MYVCMYVCVCVCVCVHNVMYIPYRRFRATYRSHLQVKCYALSKGKVVIVFNKSQAPRIIKRGNN